jgi:hypothetical protein
MLMATRRPNELPRRHSFKFLTPARSIETMPEDRAGKNHDLRLPLFSVSAGMVGVCLTGVGLALSQRVPLSREHNAATRSFQHGTIAIA